VAGRVDAPPVRLALPPGGVIAARYTDPVAGGKRCQPSWDRVPIPSRATWAASGPHSDPGPPRSVPPRLGW